MSPNASLGLDDEHKCVARSQDDVHKIVVACNKYKVPIVPYGGATSIEGQTLSPHGGAWEAPEDYAQHLSTKRTSTQSHKDEDSSSGDRISWCRTVQPKNKLQPHIITKITEFKEEDLLIKQDMRSGLGILNYARNYIPNLWRLLSPLYAKTSLTGDRRMNFQDWSLVKKIKEIVRRLTALEVPPEDCFIVLEVDGCLEGWGGICKWKRCKFDPKASEKICAYASGKSDSGTALVPASSYSIPRIWPEVTRSLPNSVWLSNSATQHLQHLGQAAVAVGEEGIEDGNSALTSVEEIAVVDADYNRNPMLEP
ncbi:hypothetical protein ZIOFF_057037 [Zingiber officinale]|uniref:Uncharacterized protein n=1 Tax=Zingiber officinale TaxID=94328 RepID=A0A8J5FPQ8_ZINOF|nr:hypothetical protein ZIOFF_057037 [Zingiber officinale]